MPPLVAGAASRFTQREYGGLFTVRETEVVVGTTVIVGAEQSPDRISLLMVNDGATNITLSSRAGVVSGTGLLLLGNGSFLSFNAREDGDIVALPWHAIGDLAGGSLHVVESVLVAIQDEPEQ